MRRLKRLSRAANGLLFALAAAAPAGAFVPPAGAYDVAATAAQICIAGYARAHRHVPRALRDRVYTSFGLARGHRRGFVIDHLIPLELGGTNATGNLWPQTRSDAARKDRDEARLHGALCAGRISIASARAEILRAWAAR